MASPPAAPSSRCGTPPGFGLLAPLALAAALLLAACGGGGGGSSFVIPRPDCGPGTTLDPATGLCRPAPQRQISCTSAQIATGGQCVALRKTLASAAASLNYWNEQAEFTGQPALRAIKAHYAFGNNGIDEGYTGNGVTVAVIDDGIQRHQVFQDEDGNAPRLKRLTSMTLSNAIDALGVANALVGSRTFTANDIPVTDYAPDCPFPNPGVHCIDHGTAVAAPLAASNGLLGVAPKAEVIDIPIRAFYGEYCLRVRGDLASCYPEHNDLTYGVMYLHPAGLAVASFVDSAFATAVGSLPDDFDKPRYINVSLGYFMPTPDPILGPHNTEAMRQGYRQILETLGARTIWQEAQDAEAGAVFVHAAGNGYNDWERYSAVERGSIAGSREFARQWKDNHCFSFDPNCRKGYNPARDPIINGMLPLLLSVTGLPAFGGMPEVPWGADITPSFLTVVGVEVNEHGEPGPITFFSNRCGRAKDWCIAAPGGAVYGEVEVMRSDGTTETVRGPLPGTGITTAHGAGNRLQTANQGTSFAAPLVTGALATVDEAFRTADGTPQVSPHEVRRRILDTADRTGIYANRDIYGHGLLDVQAALSPQGMMSMRSPPSVGSSAGPLRGAGVPAAGLGLALPHAAVRGLAGGRIMVLDGHGFPFYLDAGRVAHTPSPNPGLSPAALAAGRVGPSYLGNLGFSLGEAGSGWGGAMVPEYALDGASGPHSQLAAGAHLAVSPLVAASLDGGDTRHMAMRLRLGGSVLSAMACSQRRQPAQLERAWQSGDDAASNCMALGWDYAAGQSFGLSLRAHRLDSGDGLYRYGLRCFGASCGMGGASATELGIGGFARLAPGLRLGWNYWQGRADHSADTRGLIDYRDMGHRAGSIALQDAAGNWSLYLQQPLRATGSIALTLPDRRTPARQIHYRTHSFDLSDGHHPLRLGFSGKLPLGSGLLALDLGTQGSLSGQSPAAPYLHLQALVSW